MSRCKEATTRMAKTAKVAKVLSKYGLDWLAHSRSPWRFLAYPKRWFEKPEDRRLSQPERARLALEELGTTYIKLGQAISTRTDLVPAEYVKELVKLQDDAPPIPYSEIRAAVQRELGCPPELVFKAFEREPMAAASIGQVHRATLVDGSKVVVKVQRPTAEEQVEEDLDVMREIVDVLDSTKSLEQYDLEGWLDEFAFTLRNELDYRREGANADRFRQNFQDDPVLYIPKIFWEHSTRQVLTMEEVWGIKITDIEALDAACIDRRKLAEEATRIILAEIFEHGFFHADPHAGNFFVEDDGTINLIDFGMVGQLDRAERESIMRITLAMANQDAESLVEELLTIGVAKKPIVRQELKMDLQRLLLLHLDAPEEDFSMARMFQDTLQTAANHHVQVQSHLLFLARALAMCEGLAQTLDPKFPMMDHAERQLREIYMRHRSPEALVQRTRENYVEVGELAIDLPKRIRRVFGQLERGELTVSARLANADMLMEHMHRATNRLSIAVILASIIVGLAILTHSLGPDQRTASLLVNAMLFVVIGGGLFLVLSFWRSRRAD
jgi:ubiquinone biosynthesis protein